jgi:uncharacterized membrane protein YesL
MLWLFLIFIGLSVFGYALAAKYLLAVMFGIVIGVVLSNLR